MNKRGWLISITIFLALAFVVLGGLLFWIFRGQATGEQDGSAGKLENLKSELTRGYHTAALLREFKDDKPESVLLVIQNDWELRATGGFITAFGEGEIVNGTLANLRIVPSEFFDAEIGLQAPMPDGMSYRISTPYVAMRDSNWDPDFGSTAGTLSRYYQDATGKTPDLVIAITTESAEQVLARTGPLDFDVNGHTLNVTSQNVTEILEDYTDQSFRELGLTWETRKTILSNFGEALLPRLHDFVTQQPIETLRLANDLLRSYDVQLWSAKPVLAQHLGVLGASQLVDSHYLGDSLMVVDSNIGARKTNRVVEQRIDYRVDLSPDPSITPTSTLHITYTNNGKLEPTIIDYYDTVRVYVPVGSTLISSEHLDKVTSYSRHGRTVFEGRLRVPLGTSKTVTLTYQAGPALRGADLSSYRLLLERQAGSTDYPAQITVLNGDETATRQTDLSQDRILTVEP
jgi:hypothetical protein